MRTRARTWGAGLVAAALAAGGCALAGAPSAAAGTSWIIRTTAGGAGRGVGRNVSEAPGAIAAGPGGTVYVGDRNGVVRVLHGNSDWETTLAGVGAGATGFAGDGGQAARARLGSVNGVVADSAGNVLISDSTNHRIRLVAASTGTAYGRSVTAGDIYTIAGDGDGGISGDGGPATSAGAGNPLGLALDPAGNVAVADGSIRVVAESTGTFYGQAMTAGDIYRVAGNGFDAFSGAGVPAATASLGMLTGVAVDGAGDIVVASHSVYRVRVVAAASGTFYGQPMTAGDVYTVSGNGLPALSGNRGRAINAELGAPWGIAADSAGDQVLFDHAQVRVAAAVTGTFLGQAVTAGKICKVAGTGHIGFAGDGGPASAARLRATGGVAFDSAGNLVIADAQNNRVQVIAASSGTFYGQAMTAGDIYTAAGNGTFGLAGNGGLATAAEFRNPAFVAVDPAGDIVVADTYNHEIRVIAAASGTSYGIAMTAGDIYAVAGKGRSSFSGDGGVSTSAALARPKGVAVDQDGNLVIADTGNNRIRVVAAATGTFYGEAMTAGHIYTAAGSGVTGYAGDSGPASSARLDLPVTVDVTPAGGLAFADSGNFRIRTVSSS